MAAKRIYVMYVEMWADNEGDLPTEEGMERLVFDQMSGTLNEETHLQCIETWTRKSYTEEEG